MQKKRVSVLLTFSWHLPEWTVILVEAATEEFIAVVLAKPVPVSALDVDAGFRIEVPGVAELAVPAGKDGVGDHLSHFVVGHRCLVLRLSV